MNRTDVTSSNIASIGYDEETRTLEIEFHSGDIYTYYPITLSGYNDLMNAASIGSYFFKNIKGNPTITCTKID